MWNTYIQVIKVALTNTEDGPFKVKCYNVRMQGDLTKLIGSGFRMDKRKYFFP